MSDLVIIKKWTKELIPYKNNPRINKDAIEYVKKSISEFGFLVPLVIDTQNNIVCGHTRYEAAKRLGMNQVPCIIASELNESQVKAFRLIDNKSQEIASWDFGKLEDELLQLSDLNIEFSMKDFNFDLPDFLSPTDHLVGMPKEQDKELNNDKTVIKILFNSYDELSDFLSKYREELTDNYGCNISITSK